MRQALQFVPALLGVGLLAGTALPVQAQVRTVQIGSQSYQTLRDLAEYVDVGTQYTLDEARELTRGRGRAQRQFLEVLDRFGRRMDTFHDRVDDMETRPVALDTEVASLRTEARRVNTQLLRIAALRPLRDDWRAVMDGIDRMRRVIAGQRVTLPPQPTEWAIADDPDFDRVPAGRVTVLTGRPLADFRALTGDLSTRLERVVDAAERRPWRDTSRRNLVLGALGRMTDAVGVLTDRARGYQSETRVLATTVEELLRDARQVGDALGDRRAQGDLWSEWQEATAVLDRLAASVGVTSTLGREPVVGHEPIGGAGVMTAADLQQFRRLAHELDTQVARVHETAERSGEDLDVSRREMLVVLRQFNQRTRDLHEQTDTGQFDVRVVDKIVDALLADAGKVDAKMRDTRIFMSTWQEWTRAMEILREMDRLVHR